MSEILAVVISDLVTLLLSLGAVVFATGRFTGEIRADISQIKRDIAKIQGMFVVKIRHDAIDKG